MEDANYDQIEQMEQQNWWYQGRRDLFQRLLQGKKFHRALDIGCGVGSNISVLQQYAKTVLGIDNSKKAVEYCAQKGFNALLGDVHQLAFANDYVDLVVCADVLEHVDDEKAITEISRVLKPGGMFLFAVPANQHLWNDNDTFSHHLRRYDKQRLRQLLEKEFTLTQLRFWNFFSYFPSLVVYNLQKLKKNRTPTNNLTLIPAAMNTLLYKIISVENKLFTKIPFPQGVSLVGMAVKK